MRAEPCPRLQAAAHTVPSTRRSPGLPQASEGLWSCWDPLSPPRPLSSSPHSTFHLPPCQCLSHQVGPGREGRTGWKRLEKWVTLGGLVKGRLGGAGRARRGFLCLLPEGPAPPLLGHLWGQVA